MRRKTTVWIFQATNKQNHTREDMEIAKKKGGGTLKRGSESLLIAAQN